MGALKRTALVRKTPLRAKAVLAAKVGIVRREPQSAKRVTKKRTGPTPAVAELVFARDGGRCVRCGMFIRGERGLDYSLHHRLPRRAGGSRRPELNLPANLVTLCGSATTPGGCHTAVESERTAAYAGGWLLSATQVPSSVPVESWWGWVYLDDSGRWTEVPS